MKNIRFRPILLLCGILLAGCADGESREGTWRGVQAGMDDLTAITERTEYYDIVQESEEIFQLDMGDPYPGIALKQTGSAKFSLGTQYDSDEPVLLWAEARSAQSDIYLYRKDGSRELLLEGVPTGCTIFDGFYGWRWYIGREGDFYCWHDANYSISHPDDVDDEDKKEAAFAKISASGEILYEKTLDRGISVEDFRQMSDGRCFLILKNAAEQTRTLAELDTAEGSFRAADRVGMLSPLFGEQYLGAAGAALAVFNDDPRTDREIVELNPAEGTSDCLLSFTGTTYIVNHAGMSLQDFRVLEDGSVEILWIDSARRAEGILERLRMAKVEKIPIVMRGSFVTDGWIAGIVSDFNRQSGDYHVIMEDCGKGNDVEDFARLTSIQLASGKGPDIIQAGFMEDYIAGMLEKGVFEDLTPYMEESGVREEDYFPAVFGTWREGGHIYGVNPKLNVTGYWLDETVLGGREEPDMETLADALLSWEGKAVYLSGRDSGELLELFFKGTDTLWGMVDWERGRCDFGGELFAKMLEAAKRYGDDERKGQLPALGGYRNFGRIYNYEGSAEQESGGKVTSGVMFDDGCHGEVSSQWTMAVNSNSANKEGAWEFLRFLLGEEAQGQSGLPVNRRAFEQWLERQRESVADGNKIHVIMTQRDKTTYVETYGEEDLTEEKIAEYKKELEEAKACPIRTAPILDVILEESENYFNGSRSAEQVSEVVANRVQLYLDEIRKN